MELGVSFVIVSFKNHISAFILCVSVEGELRLSIHGARLLGVGVLLLPYGP